MCHFQNTTIHQLGFKCFLNLGTQITDPMETLNKNWFAFTLIAIIFGLLGFIIGRQGNSTTHRAQ